MHRQSAGRASTSSSGNRRSSVGPLRVKHDNIPPSASRAAGNGFKRQSTGTGNSEGRKSIASKSNFGFSNNRRPSSGYGRSNVSREVLRESRPISDKSYMQKEIRRIIEFLQENGYSSPVSVKQLMSPTTKDFVRIFQFLYNFLDEAYVVGSKIDEEIPVKLKEMRYPFTISKSSMCTLGSSHAWPHILGALHWLLDSIQYAMNTRVTDLLFNDEAMPGCPEEQAYSEVHFDYLENTYAEYMNGQDQYDVHERKLREAIQMNKGVDVNMENLIAEEERLLAELQELEQQQSRIPNLQEQVKAKTIDCERFAQYLVSLGDHKKTHELKLQEIQLHLGQMELEESELDGNISHLEYQLEHQELSAKDVERMQTELRQANSSMDQVERENHALDQEIWSEERSIAKKQEELEKKVNCYNSVARKLKLIPADAENAHGIDYELRLNFHSIHTQHSPMLDFVGTIKPALIQLKKNINGDVHRLHSHRLNEDEAHDQVKEMTEGKKEEIRKLECQVNRLEKDINAFKEKSRDETETLTERLSGIEQQKEMARVNGSQDMAQTQEQVRHMQSRYEEACLSMELEKENYNKFLTQVCTMILEHKTKLQNHVEYLQEETYKHLDAIRGVKLPLLPKTSS